MGAAPPRQTEIRLKLPGGDFNSQLRVAMDAFFAFGFPAIGEDALSVIRRGGSETNGPICLSVITSSDGFVRLGLLLPKPNQEIVSSLCSLSQASVDDITRFQGALASSGPAYAEYQYLMKGFGYGVYKEGAYNPSSALPFFLLSPQSLPTAFPPPVPLSSLSSSFPPLPLLMHV